MQPEPFFLTPEIGIPFDKDGPYTDMFRRAKAVCNTAEYLDLHFEPLPHDFEIAEILTESYAEDPVQVSKAMTDNRAENMTPACLILTGTLLNQWGHQVVESAVQIRHLVTNLLVNETDNPDARVRLRAAELLGKISDVGLFTEKVDVTITHQTSDELRAALKEKLVKVIANNSASAPSDDPIAEAEYTEIREIDVDQELGV